MKTISLNTIDDGEEMKDYALTLAKELPNLKQLERVTVAVVDDNLSLVVVVYDGPLNGDETETVGMFSGGTDVDQATKIADLLVTELRALGVKAHRHRWDGEETFEQAHTHCQQDLRDFGQTVYNDQLIRPTHDQQYTVTGHDRYNTVRGAMRGINKYLK